LLHGVVLPDVAQYSPYVMSFREFPFIVCTRAVLISHWHLLCKYEDVVRIHILKYILQIYFPANISVGVDVDDDYDYDVLFLVIGLCYFFFSAFLAFVLSSFRVVFLCLSKFRTVFPEYILLRRLWI
jgi:hypothetical protein